MLDLIVVTEYWILHLGREPASRIGNFVLLWHSINIITNGRKNSTYRQQKQRKSHRKKGKSKLITCLPHGTASFRSSHVQLHLEGPSIKLCNNPRSDRLLQKKNILIITQVARFYHALFPLDGCGGNFCRSIIKKSHRFYELCILKVRVGTEVLKK